MLPGNITQILMRGKFQKFGQFRVGHRGRFRLIDNHMQTVARHGLPQRGHTAHPAVNRGAKIAHNHVKAGKPAADQRKLCAFKVFSIDKIGLQHTLRGGLPVQRLDP